MMRGWVGALLLGSVALCAGAAELGDPGLAPLRGAPGQGGFALADKPREFEFPRDHGPHPAFRTEWWYITGNVMSERGERFGFELTFFRVALAPGGDAGGAGAGGDAEGARAGGDAEGARAGGDSGGAGAGSRAGEDRAVSAWRTHQVYLAHFAVTDVARQKFSFAQKYERGGALGLAGAQATPLHVWLDDWTLEQQGDIWRLRAHQPDYSIELEARPETAPVLNGEHGLSVKSDEPGAASYYYSIPRMSITGTVTRTSQPAQGPQPAWGLRRSQGPQSAPGPRSVQRPQAAPAGQAVSVKGSAWLDREWSSSSLGATEAGWDWFALQMNDGSALMFYSLRNLDGTRNAHSGGTWIAPSGESHPLSSQDVNIEATDHWTSRRGVRYPSRWRVRVPAYSLDVEVKPVLADQELGTTPRYWEGAVDLNGRGGGGQGRGAGNEGRNAGGQGRDVDGQGYVELVGYQ